jgi:hypothetical protein
MGVKHRDGQCRHANKKREPYGKNYGYRSSIFISKEMPKLGHDQPLIE